MMGIGKTTLAKSVYGDRQVEDYFDVRGWITMPQEYNKSQMLRLLLRSILPAVENKFGEGSAIPADKLAEQVRTQLRAKRFLIVLDNIHDSRALHDIQRCVCCGDPGSTILLTTGNFNLRFDPIFYHHQYTNYMTLLDQNQSWDLFCNNMVSLKGRMALEFEKIKSHIVEICDGLPWSIVAVAKRLAKCHDILKEWEKVKKEMESLGILDHKALTFHYNQLSEHLKVCFLYFGVFPKRKEIQVKKLIGLWIAEGFLEPLEHEELENQGYVYLQEFIERSLLLICNQGRDGKIKTCRMHSALHTFCVGEAQKAGIFCAVNTLQHTALPLSEFANSSRWLSLYTHSFDYYVLFSTNKPRSIFFFDDDPKTFVPFKLLRVLAFVPSPFLQRVSMHSRHLIFLRYLFISQRFEGLGNIVSNNPNLHTLIVSSDEPQIGAPTIHLPSTIWQLPHLRHLELGDLYTIDDPPSVVTMTNLQTLSWVSPTHCGREVYFNFPSIRKVELFYKKDLVPTHIGSSSSNSITLYNLDYLEWLERLTISISIGCIVTLPERFMFPSQLKKLNLSGAKLSQRDLTAIGMLPELRVLKLENSLLGRVWKVAKGEFRKLRFLLIEDKKLKQWQSDETYTLLCLERLVLRCCYCLEQIPLSFGGPKLKHIELDGCNPSIVASAKQLIIIKHLYGQVELIIDGAVFYRLSSFIR
ncbi:PREDICTED: putative late blight resistance protein homolog R1B-17 isoform X1 [Ipomoea nil]|uniref:putative late blight resistance protein homolog R1B-17 isoform X1 n=1 Tax=Ipomoea nil TaxID=35883 RepID=UPI0009014602|nr:PREDICTED: putative late blight resistance protein homolog R1B-17 isoform X1 [Ipomoea nil]